MRSSRRRFLVAAAVLGSAAVTGCGGAPAQPRYRWRKGAMAGGGYCNAMATDPHGGGNAAERGLKIGHLQQSGAASNSTRRNVSMAFPPKFKSLLA